MPDPHPPGRCFRLFFVCAVFSHQLGELVEDEYGNASQYEQQHVHLLHYLVPGGPRSGGGWVPGGCWVKGGGAGHGDSTQMGSGGLGGQQASIFRRSSSSTSSANAASPCVAAKRNASLRVAALISFCKSVWVCASFQIPQVLTEICCRMQIIVSFCWSFWNKA